MVANRNTENHGDYEAHNELMDSRGFLFDPLSRLVQPFCVDQKSQLHMVILYTFDKPKLIFFYSVIVVVFTASSIYLLDAICT